MNMQSRSVALLILLCVATLSNASPILWIDDSAGRIGTVDVATGVDTLVGNSGAALTDIAFDPNGNLYGITFSNLYRINTSTGAATLIGGGFPVQMNALTFSSTGVLYGAATGSNGFYTINTTTGAATLVGNIGSTSAGDLAFHNGVLYLSSSTGNLVSINVSTGVGTIIGSLGPAGGSFGLANGDDNVLYAVNGTNIFSVNTATGLGTLVVGYGGVLSGANGTAFFQEAVVPSIPEPETYAMLLAGLGLLGFAARRRKQQAG